MFLCVQLIAFIDALLSCKESEVKRVLILTPVNTLYNWLNEFEHWLPDKNFVVRGGLAIVNCRSCLSIKAVLLTVQ